MQINDQQQSSLGHPSLAISADENKKQKRKKKMNKSQMCQSEIIWVKILSRILYSKAFHSDRSSSLNTLQQLPDSLILISLISLVWAYTWRDFG